MYRLGTIEVLEKEVANLSNERDRRCRIGAVKHKHEWTLSPSSWSIPRNNTDVALRMMAASDEKFQLSY
jgi:hypothetical protein